MSDFENFITMLSHGFPSNKEYYIKELNKGRKEKIIEKKRIHLNGLNEEVVYHQFIFNKDGEFISWQSMKKSCEDW